MARSALVVPFGLPAAIERLRRAEVQNARLGVPAHVTILVPFIDSARLDSALVASVARIVAGVRAFNVVFAEVRRWPPSELGAGVVWLEPGPGEPFVELTQAIWAAFPECPPYGRPSDELEPHLTIGIDEPAHFDQVEARRAAASAVLAAGRLGGTPRRGSPAALADSGTLSARSLRRIRRSKGRARSRHRRGAPTRAMRP